MPRQSKVVLEGRKQVIAIAEHKDPDKQVSLDRPIPCQVEGRKQVIGEQKDLDKQISLHRRIPCQKQLGLWKHTTYVSSATKTVGRFEYRRRPFS